MAFPGITVIFPVCTMSIALPVESGLQSFLVYANIVAPLSINCWSAVLPICRILKAWLSWAGTPGMITKSPASPGFIPFNHTTCAPEIRSVPEYRTG